MSAAAKDLKKLIKQGRYVHTLNGVSALLGWDQETHMPEGGAEIRAEQCKVLAGVIHKERTSAKISKPLSKLIDLKTGAILASDLSSRQQNALKEWRRDYLIETALPKKFVEDFAKLSSKAILAWKDAREKNDFASFAPFLQKVVSFNRKKADFIGFEKNPYDALLDLYEPGMASATVAEIFGNLKKSATALVQQIHKHPQVDDQALYGDYPESEQMAFCHELLKAIGFNLRHGRLDLSAHPFSSAGHPTDSRITTRLDPKNIFSCISTVLHEAGHGFYEMGLSTEDFGTPLGEAISMGIHESQSRFWETRIGLSKSFIDFILPLLKRAFPGNLHNVDSNYCYKAINKVQPSLIRVEADEVTYPLHVILRFELEMALIDGSLAIKDLPEAWNEKMQISLGISPPSDQKGCLQDIHWAMGAMGYFPTYALGNLYAAQLFNFFAQKHPDWEHKISKGSFGFVRDFLFEHVYRYGREFRSQDLIQKVTGKNFTADDFTNYLKIKYGEIYQLEPA